MSYTLKELQDYGIRHWMDKRRKVMPFRIQVQDFTEIKNHKKGVDNHGKHYMSGQSKYAF